MRYVAAYLLAVLGGNQKPSAADIEKILSSVGISADEEKLNIVLKELSGKSLEKIITEGKEKLSSMPAGGGGGVAAAPAAAAAASTAAPAGGAAPAAKKEEKKEESEESDEDMGFGLFD